MSEIDQVHLRAVMLFMSETSVLLREKALWFKVLIKGFIV